MTHTEARELANQFGTRMCDENGETHGEELYCFDLDDIIALKEALAQPEQEPVKWSDYEPDGVHHNKPEQDTIQRLSALVRAQQITIDKLEAQPEQLREENERLHVENRRLIDRIETIGVPVGVNGWMTTTAPQPEQEPVATVTSESGNADVKMSWWHEPALPVGTKLYTSPPQRTWERPWVSLTDDEHCDILYKESPDWMEYGKAIEAKLKEKNT